MGDVISFGRFERPRPPEEFIADPLGKFKPSLELSEWIKAVFIEDDGPLANPDHQHLQQAVFGVCWTLVGNTRGGRRILAQAELGDRIGGTSGKWAKNRAWQQLEEWFGMVPDFLLTFDAYYGDECDDGQFCALVEHELYHCAQEYRDGVPLFSRATGRPKFTMKGHDVEEFVGVVSRYGAEASGVSELVSAANRGPQVASVQLAMACGTCQARRTA